MRSDTLGAVVFLLITIFAAVSYAAPVTDFRLGQNEAWRDLASHRFFGPWRNARKKNGEYVDYADYGAEVPGFYGISMDEPVGIAEPQDFLSRHDMGLPQLLPDYGPPPLGLAVFRVGVHPDYWLSKNVKTVGGLEEMISQGNEEENVPTSTIEINK